MDAEAWRAAKGVLAEALSCPPGERAALVNARCPDPDMRREVQAYLDEYDEHFLESVITVSDTIDSTNGSGDAEDLPDIREGDHIGPYVVLGRLGVGGMGHVFLGNDTRLQRKVALKCLSASASAGELRARILHEARAAARITHPNIAIVHDVIEHEHRPFLVMEYVEGENLAELIKRERPPLDRIVTFIRQLASALAAAHGKGIVHRDLKPANIQVTPEGSVKILDFGVAHAMSAATTGSPASSAAGLTVPMSTTTLQGDRRVMHPGTPAYMSPEQMFGRPIDQRSDIYSLGVIVYEMATGHRPYSTDDPLEVVLTLSKNFLRPGDAETSLPAQINDVVGKMLAVKPDDRYQTAGELENALIALTAPVPPLPAAAPVSRIRVAGRAAIAVAVALSGVMILGFIETAAFNITLGRRAPFDRESPVVWMEMGLRGLLTPLVYTLGVFVAIAAVRFVVRLLSLSRGIEHLLTTGATRTARLSARLGLDEPLVLGQAVTGIGVVVIAAAIWYFRSFIAGFATASISTHGADWYGPLQPSTNTSHLYRFAFTVISLGFGLSALRIRRLQTVVGRGSAGLAIVAVMFVVSFVMCQLPYRIVWKNEMPKLEVAGERCYAIGASAAELLIHCPDRQPPRNRIVGRSDPAVRDTGIRQNIFTPPETPHE
jgi:Protein kinase domain